MKNRKLLQSLNFIDDKYIKEAEPKMTNSRSTIGKFLTSVACLALVAIIGLYLFIPLKSNTVDLSMYADSEYSPLIAAIDNYVYKPKQYKNNFKRLTSLLGNFNFGLGMSKGDASPNFGASAPETDNNYIETTDNQVNGVIEADLLKRTATHAFRLGNNALKVYTIAAEASMEIAKLDIPKFSGEIKSSSSGEMYLSLDGKTITVIKTYSKKADGEKYATSKVGITSIDVSDPAAPTVKKQVSIDGSYNTSRMVDGKLILISEYSVRSSEIDYAKPETFVPSITDGDTTKCIEFKDIIYPDKLTSLRYNVVSLMSENGLQMLGANALLCYNSDVYVSNENVYVTRDYSITDSFDGSDQSHYFRTLSDIQILKYADGTLENKGTVTVDGTIRNQYSMDEYNGHLRVVTSTNDRIYINGPEYVDKATELLADKRESASLTVFNLDTNEKIAEVRDFAPENEEAMSVRFNGETAYVCTAEVVKNTDPVYFFDLSDYTNITYTDTGVIDGFSTSLIQLGDGYLLGIGQEDRTNNKVEVYEEADGKVVSVDKYLFQGNYSTDYKAYFIDRESDMFGFAIEYRTGDGIETFEHAYVLLAFNGYELVEVYEISFGKTYTNPSSVRVFIVDGYLYFTNATEMKVYNITE
jgi:uncharacterized secreted protein with C-terminal beta-propeller domain